MKRIIKNFLLRGTFFAGFGPIIYGIVLLMFEFSNVDPQLTGIVVFKGIISTYILAFIISGISIIWNEEKLGLAVKILIHGFALYISYLSTYLINGWLTSNLISLIVFTAIFVLGYGIIWLIIYLVERIRVKNLNNHLD